MGCTGSSIVSAPSLARQRGSTVMEIADLYPYWARERDALISGVREIAAKLKAERTPEEVQKVFDWIPPGGKRSINDLFRHIAYVEYYIIDKLILDHDPKTI